jgi:hypothetical protein
LKPYVYGKQVSTTEKSSSKTSKKSTQKRALELVDYRGKLLATFDSGKESYLEICLGFSASLMDID